MCVHKNMSMNMIERSTSITEQPRTRIARVRMGDAWARERLYRRSRLPSLGCRDGPCHMRRGAFEVQLAAHRTVPCMHRTAIGSPCISAHRSHQTVEVRAQDVLQAHVTAQLVAPRSVRVAEVQASRQDLRPQKQAWVTLEQQRRAREFEAQQSVCCVL